MLNLFDFFEETAYMRKIFWGIAFLQVFNWTSASAQFQEGAPSSKQNKWVDSVFNSLSTDQRLGQLFMVAAFSNKDERHYALIEDQVRNYNLGGLIFFQGGPVRQAHLTNRYQKAAAVPLFIAMDAEWGLGMRLDSVQSYPRQIALGAIEDNQQIYRMGAEIARQCLRLGVHINFAPVVDVNVNPKNPVIGFRSFGENKYKVSEKGLAYMKGLQEHGVMANAKHFPGHGDTDSDSHYGLPIIKHSKMRMDSIELYPFKQLIEKGLMSAMVAHISVPIYDSIPNKATTLSKPVVTDLLKNKMGFEGLIFTDALNMKGVAQYYAPGDVDVLALMAGNDVLLYSEDVPLAISKIKEAFANGMLNQKEIDQRVKKILRAKYQFGLDKPQRVAISHLYEDLNNAQAKLVKHQLYEQAITVVKNEDALLPFTQLENTNFASLSLGAASDNEFQAMLGNYAPFYHFNLKEEQKTIETYSEIFNKLKLFDVVVVGVHGLNNTVGKKFGVNAFDVFFLEMLSRYTKVVTVVFGNPYSLAYYEGLPNLVCAYQDEPMSREIAPQVLFGALEAKGKLPVSASVNLKEGLGLSTPSLGRLAYTFPEAVGMDSKVLARIDEVAQEAILDRATPGCQVLVAKNGKVIFQKAYGYQTYDSLQPVNLQTIYDIASITKVVATLQAVMYLEDKDQLDLGKKVSYYLPELKETNKKSIGIEEVLAHQAGLQPYIPFWRRTLSQEGSLQTSFYSIMPQDNFMIEVASGLYSINTLRDSIWSWTVNSDLLPLPKRWGGHDYKYSDMGFYMMQKLSETLLKQPMETFLEDHFYSPLGLSTMTYLPLCKFPIDRIAPTEMDNYFRKTLICGIVHDQGAAMYGGIAGHAGIFSNANDLAVLMQMNLQGGSYGGKEYFRKKTIDKFTEKQFRDNRRGLGWDKPAIGDTNNPASKYASSKAFGHTGFTGTAVWADPEYDLVYIFLSNRIYPDASNNKLIKNNIRTRIQDVVYEAMWTTEKSSQELN